MNYEAIKIPPASFICGFAELASCEFAAGERFSNIKYPGCPRMTLWVVLYTLRPCSTRTKSPLSLQDGVWFRVGRMTYTDLGRHKFTATRMWFPYGKQSIKRTVLFFYFCNFIDTSASAHIIRWFWQVVSMEVGFCHLSPRSSVVFLSFPLMMFE